jgi:3-oxoacyl-[acyl-carrier protein] reductase
MTPGTELAGKVALVTGAARNIGRAIARSLAAGGASVMVNAHTSRKEAEETRATIESAGARAEVHIADVTDPAAVAAMVEATVARFGRLDILVNNNAHPPSGSPVEQISDAAWREMMARLLDEPFFCLRAALRVMRPAGRGKIINMSSAAAFPGLPNYAAYTAARAGVNGLTKAVGREVAGAGIQVNAIAQNYVENPTYFPPALTGDPVRLARMVKNIPAGRLARSEESARLAVYLASEDADFFIGQVIPFAGGWVTP